MGVKVCLEDGCWEPTPDTRCKVHEAAWQAARNRRPGRKPRRTRAYMDTTIAVGSMCWCCGTTEDLTRHHVNPLARDGQPLAAFMGMQSELIPMCRRCNSSIGTKRMAGLACPMHGGVEA